MAQLKITNYNIYQVRIMNTIPGSGTGYEKILCEDSSTKIFFDPVLVPTVGVELMRTKDVDCDEINCIKKGIISIKNTSNEIIILNVNDKANDINNETRSLIPQEKIDFYNIVSKCNIDPIVDIIFSQFNNSLKTVIFSFTNPPQIWAHGTDLKVNPNVAGQPFYTDANGIINTNGPAKIFALGIQVIIPDPITLQIPITITSGTTTLDATLVSETPNDPFLLNITYRPEQQISAKEKITIKNNTDVDYTVTSASIFIIF